MESLPLTLSNAIDRELASIPPDKLRMACADLTERYARKESIETQLHRQAYIAARLPATYGVARDIFRRMTPRLTSIKSLLDLGAGVGSLAWAAKEAVPHLQQVTLFEKDIELLHLGQHLTQNHLTPLQLAWCRDDITQAENFPPHDAVVLSYVLNELHPKEQLQVLMQAYQAANQCLVLIEPGTPQGFCNLLTARQVLLKLGAHSVAPCPHNGPCPLTPAFKEKKDWCHFSVRIPRGKYHKRAKEGALPYEDEKYAYLVISPHTHPLPQERIIKAPIRRTGHVILDLCTHKEDLKRVIVSKKDGKAYAKARANDWGDERGKDDRL